MKKLFLVTMAFVLAMATLMPVHAAVSKSDPPWLGTTFKGTDDYYGATVYAYMTGTTAVLPVVVTNDEAFDINVTKVYVLFDWGLNYTSVQVNTTEPLTLKPHESRVVFIDFTVPTTTVASNMYTHFYTIVAVYTYPNVTDPSKILEDYYKLSDDDFAVYSADQADAVDLNRIINGYFPTSPTGLSSARGRILWNKAWKEINSAREYYRQGDFAGARLSFSSALDYIDQIWLAEETYYTADEELDFRRTEAEIKSLESMANLFNGLSAMWMLFGIGGILFGIGYIVKWLAHMRSKTLEASKA